MGYLYIPVKALFDDLNVPVIIPPPVNNKTLEIGTLLAPETACLPMKINLGNYIQSIEKGADTIVLTGSCGPCRFGYYGIVEQEILRDMGYNVDVVILDTPGHDPRELFRRIRKISGNRPWPRILKAFVQASEIIEEMDKLQETFLRKRPREFTAGETDKMQSKFENDALQCIGSKEIMTLIKLYKEKAENIPERVGVNPIHIGLVGEIYTLIEPYVNLNVEKRLGKLGVHVHRGITLRDWVKTHLSLDFKYKRLRKEKINKAANYLNLCIGGHAWETIASTVYYAEMGLDGVVQILPFGCMPEIVAESILPSISKDFDVPAMTLTVDELTGEAGYQTRLEAFVDLLSRRKGKMYEQV